MTIAELLALLGRSWARLVLFPGGLAALGILWLAVRMLGWERASRPNNAAPLAPWLPLRWRALVEDLSAVTCPWLAVALMPLPYARPFDRPLDAVFALALLEWPLLLAATRDLLAGEARFRPAVRRFAATLNAAPPAVFALVLLAQGVGSLELGLIAAGPLEGASSVSWALFLAGALGLLLTLPALAEAGPFAIGAAPGASTLLLLGLRLRVFGLVLLASLPWLALLPPAQEDGAPALWLAPLPPLLIALLLWGFDRVFAGRRALPWARGYLWLSLALLLVLAVGAMAALRERLA